MNVNPNTGENPLPVFCVSFIHPAAALKSYRDEVEDETTKNKAIQEDGTCERNEKRRRGRRIFKIHFQIRESCRAMTSISFLDLRNVGVELSSPVFYLSA